MPAQHMPPTLVPQIFKAVSLNGRVITKSPWKFLADNPRSYASCTATIAGTIANNDNLRITIVLPALSGGKTVFNVLATGSDTTSSLAQKIAKAISDDPTMQDFGIYATSALNVVTIKGPGLVGNNLVVQQAVTVGAETISLSNSGVPSGGSGPIIPCSSFNYQYNGILYSFQAGIPVNVPAGLVAKLVADAKPIM